MVLPSLVESALQSMAEQVERTLHLPHREAYFLSLDLLCGVLRESRSTCLIHSSERLLTREEVSRLEGYLERLLAHEPLQYILGEAPFADLQLSVARGVLIPRPETEELCTLIAKEWHDKSSCHFLDIGAGSGAITLFLAKHLKCSHGYALENSPGALPILRNNVKRCTAELGASQVEVLEESMFSSNSFMERLSPLDFVVSNPPYVLQEERKEMAEHVLRFEPEEALFAPAEDPLYFYRGILCLCEKLQFRNGAKLYLEINAKLARETVALVSAHPLFNEVTLLRDLSQKERFIKATIG